MKHSTSDIDSVALCHKHGISLTTKRQNVFDLLVSESNPLSAYDIVEAYKDRYESAIPAMSVYRILDFLTESGLTHKLESVNKYMVCEHIACDHTHRNAQFLICDSCNATEEVILSKTAHQLLVDDISTTGFKLNQLQFELHGVCKNCQNT